jgi:hypothetical protein
LLTSAGKEPTAMHKPTAKRRHMADVYDLFPQPEPPPSGGASALSRAERLERLRAATAAIMAKGAGPVRAKPPAGRGLDHEAHDLLRTFHDRGDEAVWLERGELCHGRESEAPEVFWPIGSRGALTAVRDWLLAQRVAA